MTPPRSSDAAWTDRLAARFGSDPEARARLVLSMLRRDRAEGVVYWFQLAVSVGIATLGLVLGSTAVVIAAMLLAPLMFPILALGMGLAIGSPVLVLRSTTRVAASVIVAVAASALITLALPFHDLNPEILARTSPTVLDLLVAACFALAGVYASVRPSPDASTAAGTSIGISLVPPLCASGYGLGTVDGDVALGAALLFLTNVVAIVLVASFGFLVTGYGRLDVAALEAAEGAHDEDGSTVARLSRWLGAGWVRVAMPIALLAVVWVPLRRALDEVAWEVRVRRAGQDVIGELGERVVASHLHAERWSVDARVVLVGTDEDAEAAAARLRGALSTPGREAPHVEVTAVPDAAALRALRRDLATREPTVAPVPEPPPVTGETFAERLRALWPVDVAGPVRSVQADAGPDDVLLRVVHLGAPLPDAARDVLVRSLADLGRPVRLVSVAVPVEPIDPARLDDAGTAALLRGLDAAGEVGLTVCATGLDRPSARVALVRAALAGRPDVVATPGKRSTVQVVDGACEGQGPPTP